MVQVGYLRKKLTKLLAPMRCLFCKQSSVLSTSVEHIIPESLGNKSLVLTRGIVCNQCNQYFAIKIEKPILETDFFKSLRFRNNILNKKNKLPRASVVIPQTNFIAEISVAKDDEQSLHVVIDQASSASILIGITKEIHLVLGEFPKDDQNFSRLLAKMGLEMLAHRLMKHPEGLEYLTDETQLDPIREYARYNHKRENWIYNSRKIYEENEQFVQDKGAILDKVFECDFLTTEFNEMYFVLAYKGIELALNMAGSSLEGYIKWLKENNNISPLYIGKNVSNKK
jgi:transcription elongation factor Elf1